jgi:hypothetical protein
MGIYANVFFVQVLLAFLPACHPQPVCGFSLSLQDSVPASPSIKLA